jgi:hypothetical protein
MDPFSRSRNDASTSSSGTLPFAAVLQAQAQSSLHSVGDPTGRMGATEVWPKMQKISAIGMEATIAANVVNHVSPPV